MGLYASNSLLNTKTIHAEGRMYLGDRAIDKRMMADTDSKADVSQIAYLNRADNITNRNGVIESSSDLNIEVAHLINTSDRPATWWYYDLWKDTGEARGKRETYDPASLKPAIIKAGGNLSITNNLDIINTSSIIQAENDINIATQSLTNSGHGIGRYEKCADGTPGRCDDWYWQGYQSYTPSHIYAGRAVSLTIRGITKTTNNTSNPTALPGLTNNGSIYGGQSVDIISDRNIINQGLASIPKAPPTDADLAALLSLDGVVIHKASGTSDGDATRANAIN
jgi:adhesin HecA-like repeat protein